MRTRLYILNRENPTKPYAAKRPPYLAWIIPDDIKTPDDALRYIHGKRADVYGAIKSEFAKQLGVSESEIYDENIITTFELKLS